MIGMKSARRRAVLASIVMLALLGAVGGFSTWRTHSDGQTLQAVDKRLSIVTNLDTARSYTLISAIQFAASVLTADAPPLEDSFAKAGDAVAAGLQEAQADLVDLGNEDDAATVGAIEDQIVQWQTQTNAFIAISNMTPEERLQIGQQYIPALWPEFQGTMDQLAGISERQQSALAAETLAANKAVDNSTALILGLTAIAFICALGTVTLVYSIIRPLRSLEQVASAVAAGDMDRRASLEGPQEVQSLAGAFNKMVEHRQQAESALQRLASTDSLTGLYNHRTLHDVLDQEIKRSVRTNRPLAIVMMDVDGFKLFNDTYGHQEGDTLLRQVADVLRKLFPEPAIIGRNGGDEFMAIFPNTDRDLAAEYGARLIQELAQERVRPHGGDDLPILLSIGLAICPHDSKHKEELIAYADSSLFEAKQTAGSSLVVAPTDAGGTFGKQRTSFGVLDALVRAVDRKDRYTRKHSQQNAEFAVALGKAVGLSEGAVNALRIGGLLHDVGKIGVPDDILKKPGALTDEEFKIMRDHVVLSNLIVHGVPNLQDVSDSVYAHHERWDGNGYPRGLKAEEIPLSGRIMALVDAYSAMILDRPYRKAMNLEQAMAELRANAGTQFDPDLVEPFLQIVQETAQSQAAA
jgi:diguanylate cyclase (GGDEF)-like protein